MKRNIIILILILNTTSIISQIEEHRETFKNFSDNYNSGSYENIFNDFSKEMQNTLPLESTQQFFNGLKSQAGNIKEADLIKLENESDAVYKASFEKTILAINISIDKNKKINGLFISPFVDEIKSILINHLFNYPQEISKVIYSHVNNFPDKTQLSIGIIENGTVNYYGVILENDTLKAIENQNKIFEIGSLTKVFTASVLASLTIDKKLNLNDFVNSYYDFPFMDNRNISFLSLANHTSGLPRLPQNLDITNKANPYKTYGIEELNDYLANLMQVKNDSNKIYNYSNLGAGLLGHTLGLSQESTFYELLQKRIFNKYAMDNSFISPINLNEKLVKGLNENGDEVSNWEFDVLFGGGGILSTTEDLVKFAKAQFSPKNLELDLTREPTFDVNENMKIGLGWHILKSDSVFNLIWHNGATGGYTSSMILNTEKQNGVIILSNVSGLNHQSENIDDLSFDLIKMIENL